MKACKFWPSLSYPFLSHPCTTNACDNHTKMTVANVTQLKAVLSKENNICNILSKI